MHLILIVLTSLFFFFQFCKSMFMVPIMGFINQKIKPGGFKTEEVLYRKKETTTEKIYAYVSIRDRSETLFSALCFQT